MVGLRGGRGVCTVPGYTGECTLNPSSYETTAVTATFEKTAPKPPKCSLQTTSKVPLKGTRAGTITLGLDCTEAAAYSISGKVATVRGHRRSTVSVVKAHGRIGRNTWKNVTVKLSNAALAALRTHLPVSATFVLSAKNAGGKTTMTHRIRHLR
jgi:hypothetical protein